MNAHKVKTEAVNMVFLHPILDALHHILSELLCLRSCFVSASRSVGRTAVSIVAEEISRGGTLKTALSEVEDMVVDNIHDNPYASLV